MTAAPRRESAISREYTKSGELILPKNFNSRNCSWRLQVRTRMGRVPRPPGRGYFPGKLNGADVTVKDSKRYADTEGWGYFNFDHHEPKAAAVKVNPKAECASSRMASARTQFYPLLKK
jgi:hypothetical protein